MLDPAEDHPEWPTAMATVLRCKYEVRAGRAIAFGLPSSKHFRIAYNYWANGELHEAEMFRDKALPVGSLFPLRYHPADPQRSRHADQAPPSRMPLLTLGLLSFIALCLLWLLALRGCG